MSKLLFENTTDITHKIYIDSLVEFSHITEKNKYKKNKLISIIMIVISSWPMYNAIISAKRSTFIVSVLIFVVGLTILKCDTKKFQKRILFRKTKNYIPFQMYYCFYEDEFIATNNSGVTKVQYSSVEKFIETDELYFFILQNNAFYTIDKNSFTKDEKEEFSSFITKFQDKYEKV